MSEMNEARRLKLIVEAVRYCQRVKGMGMPPSCYTKALREPVYFLWERRGGKTKERIPQYRSQAAVGSRFGDSELVYDHGVPFNYLQADLLQLDDATPEAVRNVLLRYETRILITKAENARLNASGLQSRMPPMWDGLAMHTGLRRGSMYRDLVWGNIDMQERVAKIPRTKNGDPVVVPLNGAAMRALAVFRSRGDGIGRVVRNLAGQPLNVNCYWFVPAVRKAGLTDFRWHDLRHTYASRLRQTGTPPGNIAELLGHKGLAMTRRYAHLSISNLHDAVARICESNSTPVAPEPIPASRANGFIN